MLRIFFNCFRWYALSLSISVRVSAMIRNYRVELIIESVKKTHCHNKSYRLAGVSLGIFYEERKTFLQIKQQEPILSLIVTNCEDD